ncbi:UTP--glucose-1-phosphate uridylyltransferase [Candidatus Falkowbacteria bacterium]|nr:UTP--glucose-1-phosphate uridylyltransferase [Candidatus Falkowbacteria bacterium]
MQKIRKAIIPAAGFGTRMLPATKAMPKEMLPIVDKPVIQYVVEEAVASGITDIIIVTGSNKRAIEDHFDYSPELDESLRKQGKDKQRRELKQIAEMANFVYVRQKGPYGNGTPVLNCAPLIGDEPFAVLWADDLVIGKKPRLKQLIEVYEEYGDPVLTAIKTNQAGTKKYGIIDGVSVQKNVLRVKSVIEKPGPQRAPSLWGAVGGYVLTPDIFPVLQKTKMGHGGELWLVDAIFALSKKRSIYARLIEGRYCDAGSPLGLLKTNIELALHRSELSQEFKKYLRALKF